jgi:UDP-N-acetylmuramoyl-tripeptide--D-alanyl-D-alanine ligase
MPSLPATDDPKLREATAARRRTYRGQVIAVAGGLGKSTTRRMIETVLAIPTREEPPADNPALGTVADCLLGMVDRADHTVVEWKPGAADSGDILELCGPTIAVLVQPGPDEAADAHLLAALPAEGWAVLSGDESRLRRLAAGCKARIVWVGRGSDCELAAGDIRSAGGRLRFVVDGREFNVPVWGRHHLHAALAAIAVGWIARFDKEQIAERLARYQPLPRRCDVVTRDDLTVIDDLGHVQPSALRAGLDLLRDCAATNKRTVICVGANGRESAAPDWRQIGTDVVTVGGADAVLATGRRAEELISGARDAGMPAAACRVCVEPSDLLDALAERIAPGDVVLVQGVRCETSEIVLRQLRELECHVAA